MLRRAVFALFVMLCACSSGLKVNDPGAAMRQDIAYHTVKIEVTLSIFSPMLGEVEIGHSGSGTVIAIDKEKEESLVLTVAHVCNVPKAVTAGPFTFPVVNHTSTALGYSGAFAYGEVEKSDTASDACIMRFRGILGTPASIAKKSPAVGSRVVAAGAPLGEMTAGMVPIVEGIYSGTNIMEDSPTGVPWRMSVVTIPIAPGSSGSAIYYNGEIIGLVSMRAVDFEHLCYAVYSADIRRLVSEVKI